MSDRGRRVAKKAFFAALALACSVVAVEAILRIAAAAIPAVDALLGTGSSPTVPDPVLGHRPSPQMSDSDRFGFRNARRPRSARIVAVGDSQTYGMGVRRPDSWPHVLGREYGISTYSMAYGGYGVTHYLVLAREALGELDPDVVVVAIYAGNDLLDSWTMVYQRGQLLELLDDGADREQVGVLDPDDPVPESEWLRLREVTATQKPTERGFRSILAQHTRLYGLMRAVRRTAARSLAGGAGTERTDPDPQVIRATVAEAGPEVLLQVRVGPVTTVLTPGARGAVEDLSDPRIREGLRLSLEAIRRLHLEASRHGTRLLVLMLPTKELVFSTWVERAVETEASAMGRLVEDETRIWEEFAALCDDLGVECVSTVQALRDAVMEGSNPYFPDWDGHPSALGHRVIARTVAASSTVRGLRIRP